MNNWSSFLERNWIYIHIFICILCWFIYFLNYSNDKFRDFYFYFAIIVGFSLLFGILYSKPKNIYVFSTGIVLISFSAFPICTFLFFFVLTIANIFLLGILSIF